MVCKLCQAWKGEQKLKFVSESLFPSFQEKFLIYKFDGLAKRSKLWRQAKSWIDLIVKVHNKYLNTNKSKHKIRP